MKTVLISLLLLPAVTFAQIRENLAVGEKWREIEALLAEKEGWKYTTSRSAEKALFDAVAAYSKSGISAYWKWYLRDAVILPADVPLVGSKDDAIWIGQLNDLLHSMSKSKPRAIFLINARTGAVFTSAKPLDAK